MSSNSPVSQPDPIEIHWTDLLLGHPELVAQFIIEISADKWECRCGNTHDSEGFDPCDEFGEVVPAELGPWDGILYVCTRCWRVIDGNTLEILGVTEVEVVNKNLEYRWSYLSE